MAHAVLLGQDEWIIDGYGSIAYTWEVSQSQTRWVTSICRS